MDHEIKGFICTNLYRGNLYPEKRKRENSIDGHFKS